MIMPEHLFVPMKYRFSYYLSALFFSTPFFSMNCRVVEKPARPVGCKLQEERRSKKSSISACAGFSQVIENSQS